MNNLLEEISILEKLPNEAGIYLIKTKRKTDIPHSLATFCMFQSRWLPNENPKKSRFDISNQEVISWFREIKKDNYKSL